MNILEARRRVLGGEVHKKTAEGNPISVRSLARMRPGLKLFGRSEQFSTTGAQLFDVSAGGAGWIDTETGEFVTSNDNYVSDFIKVSPAAQYRFNTLHPLNYMYTYNAEKVFLRKESYSLTFITGEDVEYIRFAISAGADVALEKANVIMFNTGSEELPWEPYTGGKPSPSPDYPQEITSAGDNGSIGVDVYGGNLLDIGILTDLVTALVKYFPIEVGSGSFTLSSNVPHKNNVHNLFLLAGNVSEGANSALNGVGNGVDRTVTSVDGYVTVGARLSSDNPNNPLDYDIMLNAGTAGLPYEPYKQPQSLTVQTPNGLPGIPVQSGGNYTDENGQQWICDEIDFKRGKYVQRIDRKTFNATDVRSYSESERYGPYIVLYTLGKYTNSEVSIMSDKFIPVSFENRIKYINAFRTFVDNSGFCNLRFPVGTVISNINEAKNLVNDISPKCIVVLKNPIETDLSEEQLSSYVNLHTNRPTTVVSATDGAGLEITYKTKKSLEVTD